MSAAPFIVLAVAGAVVSLTTRGQRRTSLALGLLFLAGTVAGALAIRPGETLTVGDVTLATTDYERAFLVLGTLSAALLSILASAAGWTADLPAASLIALGALSVALEARSPIVALLAALAAATPGFLVSMHRPARPRAASATRGELRVLALTACAAVAALAWLTRPQSVEQASPGVGLAFAGLGLAVALRSGAVPFHAWASRVAAAAPRSALPLLMAWIPAGLAVVVLGWTQAIVDPGQPDLAWARTAVIGVGVATILLGLLGALLQDDVEQILLYSIVQDGGVVLLAIGSLDAATWGPARTWLLGFVVAKSAFAAWSVALRAAYGTGRLAELDGWLRRAPILLLVLLLVVAGTVGWPGLAVFEARATVVRSALSDPLRLIVLVASVGSLAYYARLLLIGMRRPSPAVTHGEDERPRWPDRTALEVALPDARLDALEAPAAALAAGAAGQPAAVLDTTSVAAQLQLFAVPQAASAFAATTAETDQLTQSEEPTGSPAGATPAGATPAPERHDSQDLPDHAARGRRGAAARERLGRLAGGMRRIAASRRSTGSGRPAPASGPRRAARTAVEAWRLNRVPVAAALALILGAITIAASSGAFGMSAAAAAPRPSYSLVTAPAPSPTPSTIPSPEGSAQTGSPGPAFLPIPTPVPTQSASTGASASAGSASATASPRPPATPSPTRSPSPSPTR